MYTFDVLGEMSGSTRKIIIASGDSTPQEMLDLLWNEGYEPLCARTRSQTLDLLNARSDIHAVLMDIDLEEDFGGVHTAWEIQADSQGRSIPVFFYPRQIDAEAIHAMRGVHHAGVVPRDGAPELLIANLDATLGKGVGSAVAAHTNGPEQRRIRAERFLDVAAAIILAMQQDGTISLLNDSGHRLLGYEPGTLIGKNWFETCVPEHSRATVREVLTGLMRGEGTSSDTYENAVLTKDGGERTVLWHNSVLTTDGAESYALLSSGEDITDRKRMEQTLRKRLRYEEAIADASRVLAQPRGQLDEALSYLRTATESSRVYIFENVHNDRGELCMSQIAETCAPEITPQIYNPEMQLLPYANLTRSLRDNLEGGIPFDAAVRELPEGDRSILEAQEIERVLLLPIFGMGRWIGFMGFDQCDRDRMWPPEDVELLRSVAAMMGNTLARRHAETELQSHLSFRNLVSEISARFVRAIGTDLDLAIDYLLQQVGTHFDADRSYLFRISDDGTTVSNTHEWCSPAAEPQRDRLQDVPTASIRYVMDTLTNGDVLHVPDINELPTSAAQERENLQVQDIKSLLNVPVLTQGRVSGFLGFDGIRSTRLWTREQIRGTGVVADILASALETRRAIEAFEEERNLMRLLLETSLDLIFFKDAKGRFTRVSNSLAKALGYENPEAVGGTTSVDHFGTERAERITAEEREMMATGHPSVATDQEISWPSGEKSWVSTTKIPLFDSAGTAIGILGIARDVTERKEAEAEIQQLLEDKELVLQEVHHRIKNNMTSVQSLLALQAETIEDDAARRTLGDAKSRLHSMEVLYDKLYRSGVVTEMSVRAYLTSLVDEIVPLFTGETVAEVHSDIEDAVLPVRTLSTLGLIVNELLTNSMKHAFPAGTEGAITLKLSGGQAGFMKLVYSDNGIGIPGAVIAGERTGLGMVLIQSLTEQLEGELAIRSNGGTEVQMSFPNDNAAGTHKNSRSGRFS